MINLIQIDTRQKVSSLLVTANTTQTSLFGGDDYSQRTAIGCRYPLQHLGHISYSFQATKHP